MPNVYNPVPFDRRDYKKKVKAELDNGKELNALLLVHGYLDAYLREWLFYSKQIKKDLNKDAQKDYERLHFSSILLIHLVIGNLDTGFYKKLKDFNACRNDFAHKLIQMDLNDPSAKKKIKRIVKYGMKCCDEVIDGYEKTLNMRFSEIHDPNDLYPKPDPD